MKRHEWDWTTLVVLHWLTVYEPRLVATYQNMLCRVKERELWNFLFEAIFQWACQWHWQGCIGVHWMCVSLNIGYRTRKDNYQQLVSCGVHFINANDIFYISSGIRIEVDIEIDIYQNIVKKEREVRWKEKEKEEGKEGRKEGGWLNSSIPRSQLMRLSLTSQQPLPRHY